jgi:DNA-binding beta-propeller fold protein YncE
MDVVAGSADGVQAPGDANKIQFGYPCGLAFRQDGSFYVADSVRHVVQLVHPDGAVVHAMGTGTAGASREGPDGNTEPLNGPHGLAVADNGDLFIADTDNHQVLRLGTDGQLRRWAGTGLGQGPLGDGGSALAATVASPEGLALASDGGLFVTQWKTGYIRRIDPDGTITTVAGTGESGWDGDGPATRVRLNGPGGPALAPDGSLVFTDMNNNRVRRVRPDGMLVTIAGSGQRGASTTGTIAADASLANPIGAAVSPGGDVYFCELNNNRVVRIAVNGTLEIVVG